jgi:hypothetical protein
MRVRDAVLQFGADIAQGVGEMSLMTLEAAGEAAKGIASGVGEIADQMVYGARAAHYGFFYRDSNIAQPVEFGIFKTMGASEMNRIHEQSNPSAVGTNLTEELGAYRAAGEAQMQEKMAQGADMAKNVSDLDRLAAIQAQHEMTQGKDQGMELGH